MHVFVYEFVTGGGFLSTDDDSVPLSTLVREGAAMVRALAADFACLPGTSVSVLQDARFDDQMQNCDVHLVRTVDDERAAIRELAEAADYTVVVAPEFDGFLVDRYRQVTDGGGRILGPPIETVALAGDKHRLAQYLADCEIAVPCGQLIAQGQPLPDDFTYPAVLKLWDGAGSQDVHFLPDRTAAARWGRLTFKARLEQFVPGVAVSVAMLCGGGAAHALEPCRQHLSQDGRFCYSGGALPLDGELATRARELALSAVERLECDTGYLGVDLVLGASPDDDVVIEINPRLTTSYVGLRAAYRENLAAAMLGLARGEQLQLEASRETLRFNADGQVLLGCSTDTDCCQ